MEKYLHPEEPAGSLSGIMGPCSLDAQIRDAIKLCWMMLPMEKKTVQNVKDEIHRVVERALKDLEEDAKVFWTAEDGTG